MWRRFGCLMLAAATAACAKPPEGPPPPQAGGAPPFFAVRAHGAVTPAAAADRAGEICGDFGLATVHTRTETCPSFFRGETIPDCWVLTFRCVEAG